MGHFVPTSRYVLFPQKWTQCWRITCHSFEQKYLFSSSPLSPLCHFLQDVPYSFHDLVPLIVVSCFLFFLPTPEKISSTSDYWFIPTVALEPGESHSLQTCNAPRCLSSEITNTINELLWLKSFSEETLALLNIGFDFGNNNNYNLNLSDTSLALFPSFTKNNIFEVFFLRMLHGAVCRLRN